MSIWTQGSLLPDAVSCCSGASRDWLSCYVYLVLLQVHCTYFSALSRLPVNSFGVSKAFLLIKIFSQERSSTAHLRISQRINYILALTYYGINWHIVTCVLLSIWSCFHLHDKLMCLLEFWFWLFIYVAVRLCMYTCPCLASACVCVWKGHGEFGVWKMDRKCKIVCSH